MLENLSQRLSQIVKTVSGNSRLTESNIKDMIREVRIALLEADVALIVVKDFIEKVKQDALGTKVLNSLTPAQSFIAIVNQELTKLMGEFNNALNLAQQPPAVILLAGLQGAGKTTTAAKLAKRLNQTENKKVLLVSTDIYRPAAIEQLKSLADSNNIDFFAATIKEQPLSIAAKALEFAQKNYYDVLIVDSAGRLAIDQTMMEEINGLQQTLNPVETLFVADSMLGQDAVNTAQIFNQKLTLTGIILTKMDGDSRGGAALSIRSITGKPIKFIGVSEKINGLEAFYPDRMASRILGMGDILSLIEEVKSNLNDNEAKKIMDKVKKGKKFDLSDFKLQFEQMDNMGGMDKLMDKLPENLAQQANKVLDNKSIKRNIAIINSMTLQERKHPEILKSSRKRRIAIGSASSVQQINQLLKQFEQINGMVKKFGGGGMLKMMNGFKHLLAK